MEIYEEKISTLKRLFQDLKKSKTHGPYEGLYCFCPSCLYRCYRIYHKRSKIIKESFFFVWLLLQKMDYKEGWKKPFKFNWELAERLMFQISGIDISKYYPPCEFSGTLSQKYRMAVKYRKILKDAYKKKCELISLYLPHKLEEIVIRRAHSSAWAKAAMMDSKYLEKIYDYVKKNGACTQREIQRRFSKKRILELLPPIFLPQDSQKGTVYGDPESKIIFYVGKDRPLNKTIEELKAKERKELEQKRKNRSLKKKISVLEGFLNSLLAKYFEERETQDGSQAIPARF